MSIGSVTAIKRIFVKFKKDYGNGGEFRASYFSRNQLIIVDNDCALVLLLI